MSGQKSPYEILGGEAGVRRLVDRFYDIMDTDPELREPLRAMHADLDRSRERLFLFLSGWLGGPDLYVQQFGHPRLRARHLPFSIDDRARDQWMQCMRQAMSDVAVPEAIFSSLEAALQKTADFMRNR